MPMALVADDICGQAGDSEACALNAVQLRALKAQAPAGENKTSLLELVKTHPVLQLELFRPVARKELSQEFSNVDMYSVEGVIHILHTRVVWEHEGNWDGAQEPRLDARPNGIDFIAGISARVRNPDSVIAEVGSVHNFVDFAANAAFVNGMATGPRYNWDFGDIVGVAGFHDKSYPSLNPFYQFSLSGYCPNLDFDQKASQTKHSGYCMKYSDRYGLPQGETLKGGLCPNGTQPGAVPTGGPGCVYTYTPPVKDNITSLDELVGITAEDCGGRPCRDWQDFRIRCTNHKYKVMFDYRDRRLRRHSRLSGGHSRRHSLFQRASSPMLMKTTLCVEYDIHKACAKDCNSPACLRIPPHRREVGLPFWKGRCDPMKNARRAEILAQAMGVASATKTHSLVRTEERTTCLVKDASAMCHPDTSTGGMYCSRAWAGVCQPCYIPGTVKPYAAASTPTCPWDILRASGDYAHSAYHPKCASNSPKDLCCLYSNTCDAVAMEDALDITKNATEDGYAYVASLQNTELMQAYLGRATYESSGAVVPPGEDFATAAYWNWGRGPTVGACLEKMVELFSKHTV